RRSPPVWEPAAPATRRALRPGVPPASAPVRPSSGRSPPPGAPDEVGAQRPAREGSPAAAATARPAAAQLTGGAGRRPPRRPRGHGQRRLARRVSAASAELWPPGRRPELPPATRSRSLRPLPGELEVRLPSPLVEREHVWLRPAVGARERVNVPEEPERPRAQLGPDDVATVAGGDEP